MKKIISRTLLEETRNPDLKKRLLNRKRLSDLGMFIKEASHSEAQDNGFKALANLALNEPLVRKHINLENIKPMLIEWLKDTAHLERQVTAAVTCLALQIMGDVTTEVAYAIPALLHAVKESSDPRVRGSASWVLLERAERSKLARKQIVGELKNIMPSIEGSDPKMQELWICIMDVLSTESSYCQKIVDASAVPFLVKRIQESSEDKVAISAARAIWNLSRNPDLQMGLIKAKGHSAISALINRLDSKEEDASLKAGFVADNIFDIYSQDQAKLSQFYRSFDQDTFGMNVAWEIRNFRDTSPLTKGKEKRGK